MYIIGNFSTLKAGELHMYILCVSVSSLRQSRLFVAGGWGGEGWEVDVFFLNTVCGSWGTCLLGWRRIKLKGGGTAGVGGGEDHLEYG